MINLRTCETPGTSSPKYLTSLSLWMKPKKEKVCHLTSLIRLDIDMCATADDEMYFKKAYINQKLTLTESFTVAHSRAEYFKKRENNK